MKKLLAVVALVLLLPACTMSQQIIAGQALDKARQAKDTEALALKAALCATSIGAYYRVLTDAERQAEDVLCGGVWSRPITTEDVRLIRDLTDVLKQAE